MKVYRVAYYSNQHSSMGFSYHTNKLQAQKSLNAFKKVWKDDYDEDRSGIQVENFPITAKGMIEALEQFGSHNDNG